MWEMGFLGFKQTLLLDRLVKRVNNEVVLDNACRTVLLYSNCLPLIFPHKYNLPVSLTKSNSELIKLTAHAKFVAG